MEVKPNKSLAVALGKFSNLLVKQKIINPETDESALMEAVGNVVQSLSNPSSEKKSLASSVDFVKGPLATLLEKHQKSQNKIEELRKQKYLDEVSQLKSKPTITNPSKKIVSFI